MRMKPVSLIRTVEDKDRRLKDGSEFSTHLNSLHPAFKSFNSGILLISLNGEYYVLKGSRSVSDEIFEGGYEFY